MRLIFIFLFTSILLFKPFMLEAKEPIEKAVVILAKKQTQLEQSLKSIQEQTNFTFVYTSSALPLNKLVSFDKRKQTVLSILTTIKKQLRVDFKQMDQQIILKSIRQKTAIQKVSNFKPTEPQKDGKFTINGYLTDQVSGEKLISSSVFDKRSGKGTLSNSFGFYSLTLPAGMVDLTAADGGYKSKTISFNLQQDTTIELSLEYISLNEVEIVAAEQVTIQQQTEMSTISIPIEQIKMMPALLGEVDVIKAIQLLPGVSSGSEGSSGLYVRGGGPDQNLILLDDVPLYFVSHLGGLFSVFNADALSSVKLTKGGFPARYGGRLSSVLDVRMKEGNMEKLHGGGSIGLISGKLYLEGPIKKGKSSFLVSARRTWVDLFTRPLSKAASKGEASIGYYFYDLNAKLNHKFSDKDRLYLSLYLGDDKFAGSGKYEDKDFEFKEEFKAGITWGNRLGALRWNHIWNKKLFSNLTTTYTHYRFNTRTEYHEEYKENDTLRKNDALLRYSSGVRDMGVKLDFDYYPSSNHTVRFGFNAIHHQFRPGLVGVKASGDFKIDTTFKDLKNLTNELAVYAEDQFTLGKRISANIGVHAIAYKEKGKDKYAVSVEPRISARYLISDKLSFKASYVEMNQYLHLLTNSGLGLPIDLWVPATEKVPAQKSQQVAAGFASTILDGQFELSIEGYYKKMKGLIEYKEGTNFFLSFDNEDWQEQLETGGEGEAYGAEVLLMKKKGKTTGWIGYTLSWNNRQFDNINAGKAYPYKFDRRHDLSIVVAHQFNEKVSVSGSWVYGTGNALTLPTGGYAGTGVGGNREGIPGWVSMFYGFDYGGGARVYENGRNGFRMQAYHRLDFGVNFTKKKKWGERTWSFSVYNAYNRLNPFTYYIANRYDANGVRKSGLKKLTLFPIIPSVNYSFKF